MSVLAIDAPTAARSSHGYLWRIATLLLREPGPWCWIAGASLLEGGFALASPWIISSVLDGALPNAARELLVVLAALTFLAVAHGAWAGWLHERVSIFLQHRLEARCLHDTLAEYLASPYSALIRTEFGSTNETLAAASLILQTSVRSVAECITQFASASVTLLLLASYSGELAAFAFLFAIAIAGASALVSIREASYGRLVLDASSQNQQLFHVLLRAIPTLRAAGATERLFSKWSRIVERQAACSVRKENVRLTRAALMQGGQQTVTWLATAWLVYGALDDGLTIGTLMTSTMLIGTFLRVMIGMTQTAAAFLVLRPHIARVDQLLSLADGAPLPLRVTAPGSAGGAVTLRGVWYRYAPSSPWVLQDHEQSFPVGELSVLRGPSGAGKSTLLRLLAGLLRPEHGRVDVLGFDPSAASGLVGYLPQQSTLLEGSIATNLKTLSGQPLVRSLEMARLTGLSDWLGTLPMGVETIVSAGGGNLSAGQRQLLLLTAVFASDHPVVLLDEATSQLDAASRQRIRWEEICRGRTVISVQHQ